MALSNLTEKNESWEMVKKSCLTVNKKNMLSLTGAATEMKAALLSEIYFTVGQMAGVWSL